MLETVVLSILIVQRESINTYKFKEEPSGSSLFLYFHEGVIFMKYARNEIFIGTFPNGDTIKYKITEFDGDCVYAIDINTGK